MTYPAQAVLAAIACICLPPAASHAQDAPAQAPPFRQVNRPGSVDIEKEYNLAGLTIPRDQIHTLLPRDGIPALTDPHTQPIKSAAWLTDDARILVVTVGAETLGVPIGVLDWHEVVNTTIGGEAIAATYCPLCDSATVFFRTITPPAGMGSEPVTLEFGVSGALYNSNVLLYDRRDKALWSQLAMRAVSGPLAGVPVRTLPVRIIPFSELRREHPDSLIVSNETGHPRDYSRSPYASYFKNERLLVPVEGIGDALPRKTLGVGVAIGDESWFVPVDVIGDGYTLSTPAGKVRIERTESGVAVTEAPPAVQNAQTLYYSWSAFYPRTRVIRE